MTSRLLGREEPLHAHVPLVPCPAFVPFRRTSSPPSPRVPAHRAVEKLLWPVSSPPYALPLGVSGWTMVRSPFTPQFPEFLAGRCLLAANKLSDIIVLSAKVCTARYYMLSMLAHEYVHVSSTAPRLRPYGLARRVFPTSRRPVRSYPETGHAGRHEHNSVVFMMKWCVALPNVPPTLPQVLSLLCGFTRKPQLARQDRFQWHPILQCN